MKYFFVGLLSLLFAVNTAGAAEKDTSRKPSADETQVSAEGPSYLNFQTGNNWVSVHGDVAQKLYEAMTKVPAKKSSTERTFEFTKSGAQYSCYVSVEDAGSTPVTDASPGGTYTCHFWISDSSRGKLKAPNH